MMRRVLEQQEVNWQAVLSFTATVLVTFTDAGNHLTCRYHSGIVFFKNGN